MSDSNTLWPFNGDVAWFKNVNATRCHLLSMPVIARTYRTTGQERESSRWTGDWPSGSTRTTTGSSTHRLLTETHEPMAKRAISPWVTAAPLHQLPDMASAQSGQEHEKGGSLTSLSSTAGTKTLSRAPQQPGRSRTITQSSRPLSCLHETS